MITAIRMVEIHNVGTILRATRSDAAVTRRDRGGGPSARPDRPGRGRHGHRGGARPAPTRPHLGARLLNHSPCSTTTRPPPCNHDHIASSRLDPTSFFGVVQQFLTQLTRSIVRAGGDPAPPLTCLMLDATGAQAVGDIIDQLERRGVTVLVKGPRPNTSGCSPTSEPSTSSPTRTTSSPISTRPSPTHDRTSPATGETSRSTYRLSCLSVDDKLPSDILLLVSHDL